jgi:hypothetical protein
MSGVSSSCVAITATPDGTSAKIPAVRNVNGGRGFDVETAVAEGANNDEAQFNITTSLEGYVAGPNQDLAHTAYVVEVLVEAAQCSRTSSTLCFQQPVKNGFSTALLQSRGERRKRLMRADPA